MSILSYIPWNSITTVILSYCIILKSATGQTWTSIVVKNVTVLGPQITPDVTNVSRDGGYSALINGNIVWLYDDTECIGYGGDQLSFVSNTAAYANQPNTNARNMQDFGVVMVGRDKSGRNQYAILADTTVGTGGWIPFQSDELDFNKANEGKERVAICQYFQTNLIPLYILIVVFKGQERRPPQSVYLKRSCLRLLYMSITTLKTLQRNINLVV